MAIVYLPSSPVGPVMANDSMVEILEGSPYTELVSMSTLSVNPKTIYKYWITESSGIFDNEPGNMFVKLEGSQDGMSFETFEIFGFPVNPGSAGTFLIPSVAFYAYIKISAKLLTPSPYISSGRILINAGVSLR